MYTQVKKPKDDKSRAVANSVTQKKSNGKQDFGFVDNRLEAISQRKLFNVVQQNPVNVIQMMADTDLTNQVKPGSPATYKVGSKYVKKWTNLGDQRSQTMQNNWDNANTAGVRTPTYKREQLTDTNEYVFWSNECKGSGFFQHSKPGKPALLKSWLDKEHGDGYLKRLSTMFRNAKMGDPQGFFEWSNNGAFEFMDIQQMGGGQMGEYADYIDQKLAGDV